MITYTTLIDDTNKIKIEVNENNKHACLSIGEDGDNPFYADNILWINSLYEKVCMGKLFDDDVEEVSKVLLENGFGLTGLYTLTGILATAKERGWLDE